MQLVLDAPMTAYGAGEASDVGADADADAADVEARFVGGLAVERAL